MQSILSMGRIVHINIGTLESPLLRPAIVTRVWNPTMCNVQLFPDGENDRAALYSVDASVASGPLPPGATWMTSVQEGLGPRCWRWPERT